MASTPLKRLINVSALITGIILSHAGVHTSLVCYRRMPSAKRLHSQRPSASRSCLARPWSQRTSKRILRPAGNSTASRARLRTKVFIENSRTTIAHILQHRTMLQTQEEVNQHQQKQHRRGTHDTITQDTGPSTACGERAQQAPCHLHWQYARAAFCGRRLKVSAGNNITAVHICNHSPHKIAWQLHGNGKLYQCAAGIYQRIMNEQSYGFAERPWR